MSERWIFSQVSMSELVFDKIIREMPQPVGIILMGADCEIKESVYQECIARIPKIAVGYGGKNGQPIRAAGEPLSKGCSVLVELSGESSYRQYIRRQAVITLRDAGAKSVVGVYVKSDRDFYCDSFGQSGLKGATEVFRLVNILEMLEQNPPKIDEFDSLFIREEKDTKGE